MSAPASAWEQAQEAVLGACLIDAHCVPEVLSRSRAADFDEVHRPVWLAIAAAFQAGSPVDPVVISNALGGDEPSRALMLRLMEQTPSAANVSAYLAVLREQRQLRDVQALGLALMDSRSLDEAREAQAKLARQMSSRPGLEEYSLSDLAARFLERHAAGGEAVRYLTWGLPELDRNLYIQAGDFAILGGYPSEGKTALALQFALHQAASCRVGFFSLETNADKLFDRIVAAASAVSLTKIRRGALDEQDAGTILPHLRALAGRDLQIYRASGLTVADIQAIAVSRGLRVIYIDYVQLIAPDNPREPRHEQVAKISRALHTMAQSTGITVVALSQLSRPEKSTVRTRPVKGDNLPVEVPEPAMSALRESGQLEQDADAILLLWRPYPSDPQQTDRRLKLAKNKEGIAGKKLILSFSGATQTFSARDPRSLSQRIRDAKAAPPEPAQVSLTELDESDGEMPF